MKKINVEWTGSYPNLCSGEWLIRIEDKLIIDKEKDPNKYKDSILENSMNTGKEYSSWHFGDNWDEHWDYYYDGYYMTEWYENEGKKLIELIEKNGFKLNDEEKYDLYQKINECDWRSGSCGGCI